MSDELDPQGDQSHIKQNRWVYDALEAALKKSNLNLDDDGEASGGPSDYAPQARAGSGANTVPSAPASYSPSPAPTPFASPGGFAPPPPPPPAFGPGPGATPPPAFQPSADGPAAPMVEDDALAQLKLRAQDSLFEGLGSRLYDKSLTEEEITEFVVDELSDFFDTEDVELTSDERAKLAQDLADDVLRHGPIESFLREDVISEIMVNGLEPIYIEQAGRLERTNARFSSEQHLRQIIDRIVARVGRRIDESSPMVDARLPDGSRVNAIIPPLAVDGPMLTIRKFRKDPLTAQDLIANGSMTPEVADLLAAVVRGRLNVLVSGGTGTGKTTMLNLLSSFIPANERIVTIEDAVELQLRQPHVGRLESRPPNIEGKGAITIRDLVRNSLRMRPDRIVVGECRGGEALDMLQAMNTGHDGSLSTLHANTPRDAVSRLETMVLMGGVELPVRAIREQIHSAVNLFVHITRLRDGTRRVTHITEVTGMEGDTITLNDIFLFDYNAGMDANGRFLGTIQPTGLRPMFVDRLAEEGIELPPHLFAGSLTPKPMGVQQ